MLELGSWIHTDEEQLVCYIRSSLLVDSLIHPASDSCKAEFAVVCSAVSGMYHTLSVVATVNSSAGNGMDTPEG